ncbi:hypothetical protein TVAG_354720 [Trichomonas vaginalis G3]|uniref:Uncharacterized protein n=1 Tax=Trichomonas vaginalis (strain ATCC PRA-98 / G3) TaxID=412133 RepID=A2EFV7_TRIV3|nr:bromodomain family [Trichomonas vaginalis G3]EAY08413.1 hypothetical protein TVAG_354720 [Trichomonas vaginalis G3]KAI5518155.1 bromodomain family [Trichomonas vaginalis G3]|eukprot:XP_001320636.1 hypothetical protein [Trichomonas vaginalis G3]
MKQEEIDWCLKIHEKIKAKKVYSHVAKPDLKIGYSRSLNEIEEFLKNNKYLTIFDWSLDVNTLIADLAEYYSAQKNLLLICHDLESWFEKRLIKRAVTKPEVVEKNIRKCAEKIVIIGEAYDNFSRMLAGEKFFTKKGSNSSHKRRVNSEEASSIQKSLDELKDENVLLGVMRILKKWMPDLDIQENTTIDIMKMPKQCFEELKILLGKA